MTIFSRSAAETKKIASILAREITRSKTSATAFVIALSGDLGAGKTTFAQGFAKALGVENRILSPTFVLMKIYNLQLTTRTRTPCAYKYLVHIDCYRIGSPKDLISLGIKNILRDKDAIILIEWPERIRRLIPERALLVRFRHGKKENERRIDFEGNV